MAKKKKLLKKLAKAALIGGALYGGSKLLKGKRNKLIDKGIAAADADKGSDMLKVIAKAKPKIFDHTKVFGDVSQGDYGVGFKRGGHVKSMGIAKRGGGAAKR
tara:strand:- start:66 stop:374 length:309 start_codon:yes stop_codon:yes gene_type:complete